MLSFRVQLGSATSPLRLSQPACYGASITPGMYAADEPAFQILTSIRISSNQLPYAGIQVQFRFFKKETDFTSLATINLSFVTLVNVCMAARLCTMHSILHCRWQICTITLLP